MEMSKIFNQIKAYANSKNLPVIPINAAHVTLLHNPKVYYQTLIDHVRLAKHRVALSALYIGTGPKEEVLLQNLCDNLQNNSKLEVKIALDANRANRFDSHGRSSITLLQKVLCHSRAKLSLVQTYTTDNIFSRILGRIQRWSEILATFHSKFAVFDNNVILTGANLSNIYFDRRQDRYMLIQETTLLSDYLHNLLDQLDNPNLVYSLSALNKNYSDKIEEFHDGGDSFIVPLNQHAPSGLYDNDDFLKFLGSILPPSSEVYMSSGYFNPNELVSGIKIDQVLVPSEEANGFYGGRGLLKYVPRLYSALHRLFLKSHGLTKLSVYSKPGWSFHAKGMWIEGLGDLYIHIIGSSNFNFRSSNRDFETQFLLMTTNKELIERLRHERYKLWEHSSRVEAEDIGGLNLIYQLAAKMLKSFL